MYVQCKDKNVPLLILKFAGNIAVQGKISSSTRVQLLYAGLIGVEL